LIQYVVGLDADMIMPAEGDRLSVEQIGILRAWIDQGASWPDGADGEAAGQRNWSLLPLVRPAVPTIENSAQVITPIDSFILASLEAHGMTFSPIADKRTLLRRLSFDLVGLQ